jgi:hypothetical protein
VPFLLGNWGKSLTVGGRVTHARDRGTTYARAPTPLSLLSNTQHPALLVATDSVLATTNSISVAFDVLSIATNRTLVAFDFVSMPTNTRLVATDVASVRFEIERLRADLRAQ